MRVGLNLLGLTPRLSGGIELYARQLVHGLAAREREGADFVLFCNASNRDAFQEIVAGRRGWSVWPVHVSARPQVLRVVAEQLALPVLARRAGVDVLHSVSYTWPVAATCAGVVTVCDMLYAVWPDAVPLVKRLFWRVAIPLSVRRCRLTLTISHQAKADITRLLKVASEKVRVTYLAGGLDGHPRETPRPAAQAISAEYVDGPNRYVLSVGALGRHKNPETMVRALALLRRRQGLEDVRLLLTGFDYGARKQVSDLSRELGIADAVRMPGHVPADVLAALYAGAAVYLSTSLMEGFGMTVVEAMSFGIPVVVGSQAALPEIAGAAGVIVDALDPEAVAEAVAAILGSEERAAGLSRASRRRAADFSWARTADATWDVYQAVAGGEGRA